MMKHSPVLHKKLYALLKQTATHENRHELVLQFTHNRTQNSSEMSEVEIINLINTLNRLLNDAKANTTKKLFHLCHLYGWQKWNAESSKEVVDVESLNTWLVKYGKFHKELKHHTSKELGMVTAQFEIVVNKFLQTV